MTINAQLDKLRRENERLMIEIDIDVERLKVLQAKYKEAIAVLHDANDALENEMAENDALKQGLTEESMSKPEKRSGKLTVGSLYRGRR